MRILYPTTVSSSATNILDRVRERGLYRQPAPMQEFDCNIEEFNCCPSVMLATDMSILDEGMDLLTPDEFLEMFGMPQMSDSEFLGLQDFLHDYHR